MTDSSENWIRVSHMSPCPICNKPDNCSVSRDGQMVWCGRISDGSIRENDGGQFLHRIGDDVQQAPRIHIPVSPPKQTAPRTNLSAIAKAWSCNAEEARLRLAAQLGIPVEGLVALEVGWNESSQCWSFPEKDASGNVIGINTRNVDGSKKRLAGGKAGLTYPRHWNNGSGPVLLVEGGSDTAALIGIGLNVVGRPSNLGGVAFLSELLPEVPEQQDIIVIAERDEKPDGRWPGKEGAIKTASRLAVALNRTVYWSLPPDNAKDSRDWLKTNRSLAPESAANLFCSGLTTIAVGPPHFIPIQHNEAPVVSLTDWRQAMYEARLGSLKTPGYYLDTSMTGTGKTFVDVLVIVQAMTRDAP